MQRRFIDDPDYQPSDYVRDVVESARSSRQITDADLAEWVVARGFNPNDFGISSSGVASSGGGTILNIGDTYSPTGGLGGGATAVIGGSPTGGGAVLGTKQPSGDVVSLFEDVNIPGFAFVSRSGGSDGATDASGKFYSLVNLADGSVGVIDDDTGYLS